MNRGIRSYFKLVTKKVDNAGLVAININQSDANLHLNVPLYKSVHNEPIAFDIMFSLSERDTASVFGKGVQISFFRKMSGRPRPQNNYTITVTRPDGSSDVYNRVGSTNQYVNAETHSYIIDGWNSYEIDLSRMDFYDKHGNHSSYDYHYLNYPDRIEMANGDTYNLNIDGNTLNQISNTKGEIASFQYLTNQTNVTITKNSIELYRIEIEKDANGYLKEIRKYKGQELIYHLSYSFNLTGTRYIFIRDMMSSYRAKFNINASYRVTSYKEGYDESLANGQTVLFQYASGMSTVTNYMGKVRRFFYNSKGQLTYAVDEMNRAMDFEYSAINEVLKSPDRITNTRSIAELKSKITNGYFENGTINWTKSGQGTISTITDSSNPYASALGNNVLRVDNTQAIQTVVNQSINLNGTPANQLTFAIWAKKEAIEDDTFVDHAKARVVVENNGQILTTKEIVFDNELSLWQYKTLGIDLNRSYTKVTIEIVVSYSGTKYRFDGIQLYQKNFGETYEYSGDGNIITSKLGKSSAYAEYTQQNGNTPASLPKQVSPYNADLLSNIFDDNGNPVHTTLNHGGEVIQEFDSENRLLNYKIKSGSKFLEKTNQYDLAISGSNDRKNIVKGFSDIIIEEIFDPSYKLIKKIKHQSGTDKEFFYDALERLSKIQYSKNTESLDYEYEYSDRSLVTKIKTTNLDYVFSYNSRNKLSEISVSRNQITTQLMNLDYLTRGSVRTDLMNQEMYGNNGDSYVFEYNNENRIEFIKFKPRNSSNEPTPYFQYTYNSYGQLVEERDLRQSPNLVTSYHYDENKQVILITDNLNNELEYGYDSFDNVSVKNLLFGGKQIVLGYDSIKRADSITPQIFSEGIKREGGYTCFLNEVEDVNDQFVITKNLSYKQKQANGNYQSIKIEPTRGLSLIPIKENGISQIKYTSSSQQRLTYPVNMYGTHEYPVGSVMFWFKPSASDEGTTILNIGNQSTNRINVMIDDHNVIRLRVTDYNGNNHLLITTLESVILDEWNYLGLTWFNRFDGPGYPDVCEYNLQLNSFKYRYYKSSPWISVSFPIGTPMTFGSTLTGTTQSYPFGGAISAIRFTPGSYESGSLDVYYRNGLEYIFNNQYTVEGISTYSSSGVTKYNIDDDGTNLLSSYQLFPLNSNFKSLSGILPYNVTDRNTVPYDKDKNFNYDNSISRYTYVADGSPVIFNLPSATSGTVAFKTKIKSGFDRNYLFQIVDSNQRTIGLYRNNSNGKVIIDLNGSSYNTNLSLGINEWQFIAFTWTRVIYSGSVTSYAYAMRVVVGAQTYTTEIPVSFVLGTVKLSLGLRIKYTINETSAPLMGNVEMFAINSNYSSFTTLNTLKNKLVNITKTRHYDEFNRLRLKRISSDHNALIDSVYNYQNLTTNRYTNRVSTETVKNNVSNLMSFNYSYDSNNFITLIKKNSINYREYEYNYLGYLTKEKLNNHNRIVDYSYDSNGNITQKEIYDNGSSVPTETISYGYDVSTGSYSDKLTSILGKEIKYEDTFLGNPTFYGIGLNGITYAWQARKLVHYNDNVSNLNIAYEYNDKGLRIKKTIGSNVTKYFYESKNLIYEETGSKKKYYLYDEENSLYGFLLKNGNVSTSYYYLRDTNGIINGLVDTSGNIVVSYEYDAYGQVLSITGSLAGTIGQENNFLFKGYYYDFDTHMYYLKSRYYVPLWGRYLNADDPRVIGLGLETGNGFNLFAYCNNNPIYYTDENGQFWKKLWNKVVEVTTKVAETVVKAAEFVAGYVVTVNVSESTTQKGPDGTYATATVTQRTFGSGNSLFTINIGKDSATGEKSTDVGVGLFAGFNVGTSGFSLFSSIGNTTSTVGINSDGNFFGEVSVSSSIDVTGTSTTLTVGKEIDVDWEKMAEYALASVIIVGVVAVGALIIYSSAGTASGPVLQGATLIIIAITAGFAANNTNEEDDFA